jgi:hypothetical protein
VDKLSDIDRLKMFFDSTPEEVKAERYKVLKKSIEERGILVPIDVAYVVEAKTRDEKDEIGDNLKETAWKILDGYTRVQIAKELGITEVRAFIHSSQFIKNEAKAGDERGDPLVNYGLVLNIKRRHMTDEEKHKVIIALSEGIVKGIGGRPKKGEEKKPSIREKAKELGVAESTLRAHQKKEGEMRDGRAVSTHDARLDQAKLRKLIDTLTYKDTLSKDGKGASGYIGSGWSGTISRMLGAWLKELKDSKHSTDGNIANIEIELKVKFFKEGT